MSTKTFQVIALVLLASAAGFVSKVVFQKTASQNSFQLATAERLIQQAADGINQSAPIQVDKATRLLNVVAVGNTLRYRYELDVKKSDYEPNLIEKGQGAQMKMTICTSVDMRALIDFGAVMEYAYYSKEGAELEVFAIHLLTCKPT